MPTDFTAADFPAAVLIVWTTAIYVAYIAAGALPSDSKPGRKAPRRVILDRLVFFALVGLVPLLAFRAFGLALPGREVLSLGEPAKWLPLTALLAAACWAIGRYSRKGEPEIANYPQYLPRRWNALAIVLETGSWALYLAAYEFAFRGYILYALLPGGAFMAIAVETALYSFAHLPKSAKEAAGAIVFGIAASLLTLAYGSILPAFVLHLAMALGNDRGALRAAGRKEAP